MRKLVKRFISKTTKISVILMLLATLFVLEPALRGKVSFAVTFLNGPKFSSEETFGQHLVSPVNPIIPEKSHAPEPSTFILILAGLSGIIVRYVRRGFDKIKRVMDVVLSVIGLGITSPILLFATILIKLDSPGPIVYRQRRMGKNGKIFRILKLRSMRQDAEKGTGAVWAKKNDTRVTAVGRMLRKSRIDELPQLINVLRGEMSIVGPRPERPEMVRDLKIKICDYEKRLLVKPGITGLAQVKHKYDETIEDVKKKVKFDLLYIRKMCLWTDINILAQTFGVVLSGKNDN
ncbi:MAG: sugar transferase [Candidatus Omnitrophica bacterium]|nr:sugar transferase [Candidatus Omnitrophota bacterium]